MHGIKSLLDVTSYDNWWLYSSTAVNVLNFEHFFAFYSQIKSMLTIGYRENNAYPDQTVPQKQQSDLGLHCLSRPFGQATSVEHYRTSTVRQLMYRGSYMSAHVLFNSLKDFGKSGKM